jgi:hypothetical protein
VFVVVVLDQSGLTGLSHSHSTTRFAIVAAAGGPARSTPFTEVTHQLARALDQPEITRAEVVKEAKRASDR